jgi:hypothetical protein
MQPVLPSRNRFPQISEEFLSSLRPNHLAQKLNLGEKVILLDLEWIERSQRRSVSAERLLRHALCSERKLSSHAASGRDLVRCNGSIRAEELPWRAIHALIRQLHVPDSTRRRKENMSCNARSMRRAAVACLDYPGIRGCVREWW